MTDTKRLFLFAGYDKDGIIDDTLVYYITNLSKYGDVVLFMDSDVGDDELNKIKKFCVTAVGRRHGEYDFGSYKRAYLWAVENLKLHDYDVVYMVNDSVYGPFFELKPYLKEMESNGTDAFGMVAKTGGHAPHIQSWFIGMRPAVFLTDWFDEFMKNIRHQESKNLVAIMYETGFTIMLKQHNIKFSCLYHVFNRGVYKRVKSLYKRHMPFMKKVAFLALDGALGYQIRYILKRIPKELSDAIIKNAQRVYGAEYTDTVLNNGIWTSMKTRFKHAIKKIKSGTI